MGETKKSVKIGDLIIGVGRPKICVPLTAKNDEQLLEEAARVAVSNCDLVEWRIDFHEHATDSEVMAYTAGLLKDVLKDKPLLATFRTKAEGGEKAITPNDYVALNKRLMNSKCVSLVDVELFMGEAIVTELVEYANEYDIKVVGSNHDFNQTPTKEEIIHRLCHMQTLGVDIPKIAVMPQCMEDVLTLLGATYEMYAVYASGPIITMSMAELGMATRVMGEWFGSSITFASGHKASAPGQVPLEPLKVILDQIHELKA